MSWEGRSCNDYPVEKLARGVLIYGTEGTALLDGNAYTIYDRKQKIIKQAKKQREWRTRPTPSAPAAWNWINCISPTSLTPSATARRRIVPPPKATSAWRCCILGNIAWRVGRELHCDTANGHILKDSDAMKLWRRKYEPGWEPKV